MNLPPRKCLPPNERTPSFGAVSEISTSGSNHVNFFSPSPNVFSAVSLAFVINSTGPFSTSHPLGISTLTMGSSLDARSASTASNGARTGGWKENPKMASRITSYDDFRSSLDGGEGGSVVTERFLHWVCRR